VRILNRLVWRVLDWVDYRIWDARLWMVDAVYGPEPETEGIGSAVVYNGRVDAGAAAPNWLGSAIFRHGWKIGFDRDLISRSG
jgi:hypothetical protein